MAQDPVKAQLNAIADAAVHAFTSNRNNDGFDFTPAAKALATEAFNLGKDVGSGKLRQPAEEPPQKKKPKQAK